MWETVFSHRHLLLSTFVYGSPVSIARVTLPQAYLYGRLTLTSATFVIILCINWSAIHSIVFFWCGSSLSFVQIPGMKNGVRSIDHDHIVNMKHVRKWKKSHELRPVCCYERILLNMGTVSIISYMDCLVKRTKNDRNYMEIGCSHD